MNIRFKKLYHLLPLHGLIFLLLITALPTEARLARVDGTLDLYPGAGFANDGAQVIPLITTDTEQPGSHNNPFSINYFGTTYNQVYANENGVLSFGSAFNGNPGNTTFGTLNTPLIAGYLADADMSVTLTGVHTGVQTKFTTCSIACMFFDFRSTYNGATGPNPIYNWFQIGLWALNTSGDFKLELNFSNLEWESADSNGGTGGLGGQSGISGFSSGDGRSYQINGSGTNSLLGKLNDRFTPPFCTVNPLSAVCNDYDFYFYDGIPYYDLAGTQKVSLTSPLPEPPTFILLLMGLLTLLFKRKSMIATTQ